MQRKLRALWLAGMALWAVLSPAWGHIDASQRMGPYNVTVSIASVAEIDGDGSEVTELVPGNYYLRAFVLDEAYQPVGDVEVSVALRHESEPQGTLALAYQGEGGEYRARRALEATGAWTTEVRLSAPGASEPLTASFEWEVTPAAGPLSSPWLWGLGALGAALLLLAGALVRKRAARVG